MLNLLLLSTSTDARTQCAAPHSPTAVAASSLWIVTSKPQAQASEPPSRCSFVVDASDRVGGLHAARPSARWRQLAKRSGLALGYSLLHIALIMRKYTSLPYPTPYRRTGYQRNTELCPLLCCVVRCTVFSTSRHARDRVSALLAHYHRSSARPGRPGRVLRIKGMTLTRCAFSGSLGHRAVRDQPSCVMRLRCLDFKFPWKGSDHSAKS